MDFPVQVSPMVVLARSVDVSQYHTYISLEILLGFLSAKTIDTRFSWSKKKNAI